MSTRHEPRPPSCALFDFDGTMYSFDEVYPQVWRDLFDEQQAAVSHLGFWQFYEQVENIFGAIPADLDSDQEHEFIFDEMRRIWPALQGSNASLIEDYLRRSLQHMKPRAGLEALLARLDAERIPWGIISNHDARNRHKFEAMKLSSQPATFMLSVEVGIWKPDTRIFEMALDEIGQVDRDAAVMVGDNPVADIAGGRSAGMRTVLMLDGPFAATHDGSADMVIKGFEELHAHWFGE